jgi:photosystem II PsbM protein
VRYSFLDFIFNYSHILKLIVFKNPAIKVKFMETNFLGLLATVLAVFVPTVFLLTLYIQTASREEGQSSK